MNKIMKSLYFKLNEENPKHQAIIRFFDKVKGCGQNKIDVLYYMVRMQEACKKPSDTVSHVINEKQD